MNVLVTDRVWFMKLLAAKWASRLRTAVCVFALGAAASASRADTDLSIAGVTLVTPEPAAGDRVELDVVVANSDPCPTCEAVEVSCWDDSPDGNVQCVDGRSLGVSAEIATQNQTTLRVTLEGYPRPGTYRAWVWVNCTQTVVESDYANNKAYVDIVVTDAVPDTSTPPSSPDDPSDPPDAEPPPRDRPADDPDEQVGADPGSNPSNGPAFCGLFGGQSAISLGAWLAVAMAGLAGMKHRHARRPNTASAEGTGLAPRRVV